MRRRFALATLAGVCSVLAFAPFGWFPLAFASVAALFWLIERADTPRAGFLTGFAWGLGAFLAGVSWLYIALNRYGGVPMPVAALAILLFCAYLALYPAIIAALFARFRPASPLGKALLFAGLWVLGEFARGWIFTGFPWLSIGYSQTPPSPLAGLMPLIGVYGVGGVVVFVSAMLVQVPWRRLRAAGPTLMPVLVLLIVAAGVGRIQWTTPEGEPLRVALVQTNIDQGLKWAPEMLGEWLAINARLAGGYDADLVVLPETSLPVLVEYLPPGYLDLLEEQALKRDGDLVVGVFSRDTRGQIFNAAISRGVSSDQFYAKNHLVPFGEYSPPLFGWFYTLADIPMSDQTPGDKVQAPMHLGTQRIAINICYEDLFGRALLRTLPEATLMLNISNLAWYGHSLAQPQHLQIARVRALETGRPMLRSTNTGMTALVMPDASVAAVLPQFERGVLEVEVSGYSGMTPYAHVGDWLAAALAALSILAGWIIRART